MTPPDRSPHLQQRHQVSSERQFFDRPGTATLPYILMVAENGFEKAVHKYLEIKTALNMVRGELVIKEVAETFNLAWSPYKNEE